LSPLFYTGVAVLGMAFPLIVFMYFHRTGIISPTLLTAVVACQLVGNFSLRYCLLKGGLYMPLVASNLAE
jgi:formate-dependent nitrite reductase membrane component NrfD